MRTYTVVQHEGEDLGPWDWSHPWLKQHERLSQEVLREIEADPKNWRVSTSGGELVIYQEVLYTTMYDGWPYWKPGPAIVINGPLGLEHKWLDSVTYAERRTKVRP